MSMSHKSATAMPKFERWTSLHSSTEAARHQVDVMLPPRSAMHGHHIVFIDLGVKTAVVCSDFIWSTFDERTTHLIILEASLLLIMHLQCPITITPRTPTPHCLSRLLLFSALLPFTILPISF